MYNVYLFQPQYTINHDNIDQYWIPYSVGCLWSYAQQFDWVSEHFILKDLIFKRELTNQLIERLDNPHICGFSCYVWNEQYNLFVAKLIKEKWPRCIIVFGGPQVNSSLLDNDFIDSIILNEGESSFVSILDCIRKNNKPEPLYIGQRMENLSIPSPYLTGVFDTILKENPSAKWHMTMETNRGCPYQCTFCDWGSLTYTKVKKFDIERVEAEIDWAASNPVTYFYCTDANFGIYKDRDKQIAQMFRSKLYNTNVETISLQFAKNSNENVMEIAQIVGNLNKGVTISVQSLHDDTLQAIKRKNLAVNDMQTVFRLAEKYNVKTYSEFILGLPNETTESWKQGLTDILEYGQHQSIDIWFCQVLRNSELGSQKARRDYNIKTIFVKDYLALNNNKNEEIPELVELITSTNTMSLSDIVESYMYSWMIIQFHISGYSQILSKEARKLNVSFKEFYDCFFINLQESFFAEHFEMLEKAIKDYLTTGTSIFNNGHSAIHTFSSEFIYNNKEHAFDLSYNIFTKVTKTQNTGMFDLQKFFIYDSEIQYPIEIKANNKIFRIESQVKGNINLYTNRRKGYFKNIVIEIDEDIV